MHASIVVLQYVNHFDVIFIEVFTLMHYKELVEINLN